MIIAKRGEKFYGNTGRFSRRKKSRCPVQEL
jgi:hypothetical protein